MEKFKKIIDQNFIVEALGNALFQHVTWIIPFIVIFATFSTFSYQTNPTNSMYPVIKPGSGIVSIRHGYELDRGDMVVFRSEITEGNRYAKRILGLPGENIRITNGVLFIDNKEYDDPHKYTAEFSSDINVVIGEDELFVAGDNRSASYDSRQFGPIKIDDVDSKIILIFNIKERLFPGEN